MSAVNHLIFKLIKCLTFRLPVKTNLPLVEVLNSLWVRRILLPTLTRRPSRYLIFHHYHRCLTILLVMPLLVFILNNTIIPHSCLFIRRTTQLGFNIAHLDTLFSLIIIALHFLYFSISSLFLFLLFLCRNLS